jgi:hypothetical protein
MNAICNAIARLTQADPHLVDWSQSDAARKGRLRPQFIVRATADCGEQTEGCRGVAWTAPRHLSARST